MKIRLRPLAAVVALTAVVASVAGTSPSSAAGDSKVLAGSKAAVAATQGLETAGFTLAARQPVAEDRYAMAGGCYALRSTTDGTYVVRDGDEYAASSVTKDGAEPFHLQATDLGRYLLFDAQQRFLSASDVAPTGLPVEFAAVPAPAASVHGDWVVDGPGGAFTMTLPDRKAALVVSATGRLHVVDAATAGDDGTFSFEVTDGCAEWPEVETNVSGTPAGGSAPHAEVRGLLEGHMHMMAFEFIGGRARCGRPWHPYGVTQALVDCPDHEPGGVGAVLENVLSTGQPYGTHDTAGWPKFTYWPAPRSLTHEQAYYKWVERAWQGGLRTFVNLLVDNTALCQVYPLKKNSCNEMDGVRLQAQRLHELQDYIDAQSGGPGEGWFRIVKDPVEARRVMNEGKLAVVMGIEVSVLFDCGEYLDNALCTQDQIDERLDEVYDMGVRQLELVNKFDNGLSGVAGDTGSTGRIVNAGNRHVTGHWWDMRTCAEEEGHTTHAHDRTQTNLVDDGTSQTPDHNDDTLAAGVLELFGPTKGFVAPAYPAGPHCNTRGLTSLGEHLVRRMMAKGMLIDPDHMSVVARKALLDIVEAEGYDGLISSHSWSDETTNARIYAQGGVVTPYAGGSTSFFDQWVDAKADAVAHLPSEAYFGFGYGADMNGFGGQGEPRNPAEESDVDYPFLGPLGDVTIDKQVSGERVYDINVDGVSHYGLYPDWLRDVQVVAGARAPEITEDMLRGPEAYLQTWERANGVLPNSCVTPQDRFDVDDVHGLLEANPQELLDLLGQPAARDGRYFEYCTLAAGEAVRIRMTFDGEGRVGLVEQVPNRAAARADARPSAAVLAADGHADHSHSAAVTTAAAIAGAPAGAGRSAAGDAGWALPTAIAALAAVAIAAFRRVRSTT